MTIYTAPPKTPRPSAFTARRQFIQLGLATLGAAWLGVFLQSRFFPAEDTAAEAVPVRFLLADLPEGSSKTVQYGTLPVIVLRTREGLRAFSLTCTHLGCTVEWQAAKNAFYCPCHDGRFDEFGEVLAGPPPLPLEQIPVQVEAGMVIVGES
jgi:cytochrome b6-f complex iron-sulfur subunit